MYEFKNSTKLSLDGLASKSFTFSFLINLIVGYPFMLYLLAVFTSLSQSMDINVT